MEIPRRENGMSKRREMEAAEHIKRGVGDLSHSSLFTGEGSFNKELANSWQMKPRTPIRRL